MKIPSGGAAWMALELPATRGFAGTIRFELSEAPDGIVLPDSLSREELRGLPDGPVLVVTSDASRVKPGLRGNLIVNVIGERAAEPGRPVPPANRRRVELGTLPALPFEVVRR